MPLVEHDGMHQGEVGMDAPQAKRDVNYYRNIARRMLIGVCGEFAVCNGEPGRICVGQKFDDGPGMGGAGQGTTFHNNYLALQRYRFRTYIVKENKEPDMAASIFGRRIRMPVMVPAMSGVKNSLKDAVPEKDFFRGLVEGARTFGTIGMVGNTPEEPDELGTEVVKEEGGHGIPVFKPQSQQRLLQLFKLAEDAKAIAVGVDLDGCGSINWARAGRPVFRKTENELHELVDATELPVFFKGIMSLEDAAQVADSGADAIYVSNHGGRVLDSGQGVAEVLPAIANAFGGRVTIMADGCVRTGFDVLKVLALGADVALIGRPIARMSIAGGGEAVNLYLEYVMKDLRSAMVMTGCNSVSDVNESILLK
jgi:isopentenyl diphosphate isomerase/L-lactate dehydrogenase-like FMN-dependent dehydrogenase